MAKAAKQQLARRAIQKWTVHHSPEWAALLEAGYYTAKTETRHYTSLNGRPVLMRHALMIYEKKKR